MHINAKWNRKYRYIFISFCVYNATTKCNKVSKGANLKLFYGTRALELTFRSEGKANRLQFADSGFTSTKQILVLIIRNHSLLG